jgi:hypothetical protein
LLTFDGSDYRQIANWSRETINYLSGSIKINNEDLEKIFPDSEWLVIYPPGRFGEIVVPLWGNFGGIKLPSCEKTDMRELWFLVLRHHRLVL